MHYRTFHFVSPLFSIIILNLIWSSKSMYTPPTNSLLGPSDHREAYFNGTTSYIRLQTTVSLLKHTGLSFRTCIGGELFSQKYLENTISLSVTKNGLEFNAGTPTARINTKIVAQLLDNKWHTVNLEYRVGNLTLSVDEESQLIANKTYNPELLTNTGLSNEGAILLVGKQFSGCILEGPSIVFNKSVIQPHDVLFGPCPIPTNSCAPRADIIQNRQEIVDHCFHEPCMRHGKCISRPDRYECICSPRYSGKNCEVDNGPVCQKHPPICQNGASCLELDGSGDYQCICAPGFTGKYCESELRIHQLCQADPCQNNGTCQVLPDSNINDCVCAPGYTGQFCETDINECHPNPCENGGHCVDAPNSYNCLCGHTGYEGVNCELNINECLEHPCLNNAVCFDTYGSYVCQCQDGYGGHDCDQNLNECVSMPCQNKGMCKDTIGGYECLCQQGFSGKNCELSLCEGVVCAAFAECVGYRCVCKTGYTGMYPNCTETGVGCLSNPCLNGGVCTAFMDTFNCSCPPGFAGSFCDQKIDVCASKPCKNGGTCIQLSISNSYKCLCTDSYVGKNCDKFAECSDNPCQHATSCQDFLGGFYCTCEPGWSGYLCDLSSNRCAGAPCKNGATCIITPRGKVFCRCPPGYKGKFCQHTSLNECSSMPCQNGGECINDVDGFHCNCTKDFTGRLCDHPLDICGYNPCNNNGTCITKNKKDFTCNCLPGFTGKQCQHNIDECQHVTCPDGRVCKDLIAGYECSCPDGYTGEGCQIPIPKNLCANYVCANGGTCIVNKIGQVKCLCANGYTGQFCDTNAEECNSPNGVQTCVHGICVKKEGRFQCYCEPGYTGETCSLDFNECLSQPCQHNSTCLNLVNNYQCDCSPGYTGKNCDEEINECESSPCFEGSTCVDQVASFICVCQPGFTGHLCNINIDDCQSSPCKHGGLCIDGLNSYFCNCSDTGYYGSHCEINIDDCSSNPCENGASCIDRVKDYSCDCFTGYKGKNCEIDINECDSSPCQNNGTCLQRSNLTLYEMVPKTGLPDIFSQQFSFENASGYECICIDGVTGHDCEIDINECELFPCKKGSTCRNLIGGYSCECEEGTEGKHCEIEIDECDRYSPCENGNCIDKKANYFCECLPNYGGKNCSVLLTGCFENPCLNNGTCKPYVENEIEHKFNCSCQNGFHGDTCEKITTMSFSGSSYIVVNTSREEGYDIEFRFKTTLGDGLIAIGKGLTFYFLELVNGRLNLHSSLLNKWEGVFIGSELNNSKWQKVFVAINSSHLVLAANEEQTIYPINLNEGSNTSHTSFPTTYLGENIELTKSRLTHARQAFVGCTEDVIINGEWVLPQNTSHVSLVDIEVGCSRTPQCSPNPCHSSGRCTDKWRTFSCTCERPYLGHTCQYNYTAATFGYENITNSLVVVSVTDPARRAVRSIVDISMFIRTRQSVGQIFYLGSSLSGTNTNEDNHISAKLEGGELLVSILFNSTPESYTVSGVKLDNGFNHLIEVVRNISLVKVILNGTEYFRKTISGTGQLDAQVLYLGGLPEVKRPVRQTDMSGMRIDTTTTSSGTSSAITSPAVNFKGIIQDVQVSNGTKRMVVQFFPLTDKELGIPPTFGKVSFDNNTVLEGVVSDDLCRFNPCEHNGNCTITWNDFKCECPKGYKGKTCSELEFCQLKKKDCPPGSVCNNLEDGYECISNATFTGRTKPLQYIFESSSDYPVDFEQIFIKYRTKVGGTVMYVKNEEDYFFIFVHKDEVTVQWSLMGKIESHRFSKDNTNGDWNVLVFRIKELMLYGGFKENVEDDNSNVVVNDFNTTAFEDLFTRGTIYLGGSDKRASHFLNLHYNYTRYNSSNYITNNSVTESNSVDIQTATLPPEFVMNENLNIRDKFKGCLGEIRIGNLLLPFYTTSEMYTPNYILHDYFSLIEKNMDPNTNHTNGCIVCFEEDCKNNGRCAAPEQSYQCNCTAGYSDEDCSVNIDECEVSKCENGATCIDGIANFTCECVNGYEGWLCDTEINECDSNPCRNGGKCIDKLATYECICTDDYVGRQCEALRLITCDNTPCRNGSTCTDGANSKTGNNFTCSCMKGMVGALCDTPYCIAEACKHGECNTSVSEPFCQCKRGYTGHLCEEDIDDCILPTGDSPCLHDGKCTDEVDKYNCNCEGTGYEGLICEHDIDECEDEYICGEKGDCENTPGGFWCLCPPDLCGIRCALPNPCKVSPCGEHGTCNATCKTEATFRCDCVPGYYGTYCNETVVSQSSSDDSINIALIVIPIVAILLLGGAAGLAVLIAMARSKRATRGTYSPSAQEFCNPRVELDHVLKPPPEERLI